MDALGLEASSVAIGRAHHFHPDCRFTKHSVEDLPWPVESHASDIVVAFEVIEHLLEPRRLLVGARHALAQGGFLALTTPYHGLIKNLAISCLEFDRHFAVEGEHVRFFTDRSLVRLISDAGLIVREIRHLGRFWGIWSGVFVIAQQSDSSDQEEPS